MLTAVRTIALCTLIAVSACAQPTPSPYIAGMGNFSHIVGNLDRSVAFYKDVIGLEASGNARPFDPNPAIMKMGNTAGAQSRLAVLKIPGAAFGLELIEYKDIDRKPGQPHFQDPGAANLAVRVRDIDAVVERVKKSSAHVLTPGGVPASVGGRSRNLFLQDPDGFVIELAQPVPAPAPTADTPGNVIGGGIEITANDAENTAAFYRDALGMAFSAPPAFNADKLMNDTAGVPGGQFRQTRAQIPGTMVTLTFIEFKAADRKPLATRIQDPGTALVQLRVRDLDGLLKQVKSGGGKVVAADGQPVAIGTFGRIAIVRDPNNFFLELIEARQQ